MCLSSNFDKMFGNAQEYIPDPTEITDEFNSLDEDDVGGEEDLEEIDCFGLQANPDDSKEKEGVESENAEISFDNLSEGDFNFDSLPAFNEDKTTESNVIPDEGSL